MQYCELQVVNRWNELLSTLQTDVYEFHARSCPLAGKSLQTFTESPQKLAGSMGPQSLRWLGNPHGICSVKPRCGN